MSIFVLLGLRSVIVGANVGDAMFMFSVAAIVGYRDYLKSKITPDINKELKEELNNIRTYVSAMAMKQGLKETVKEEKKPEFKRYF